MTSTVRSVLTRCWTVGSTDRQSAPGGAYTGYQGLSVCRDGPDARGDNTMSTFTVWFVMTVLGTGLFGLPVLLHLDRAR